MWANIVLVDYEDVAKSGVDLQKGSGDVSCDESDTLACVLSDSKAPKKVTHAKEHDNPKAGAKRLDKSLNPCEASKTSLRQHLPELQVKLDQR